MSKERTARHINSARLISILERSAVTLPVLVQDVSDIDARWKPSGGGWSIVEVLMHMADEDTEDFRARLQATLGNPDQDWVPIDPKGWALERAYNDADLLQALYAFLSARRTSIDWLRSLETPDWSLTHEHAKLGPIAAGDLLASWAAHDALHIRQITKRMFELIQRDAGPYSTEYAGSWGP